MIIYEDFMGVFFPNFLTLMFWELFAMLCFRLGRLISLSFICCPRAGGREREEREGDACPAFFCTEPVLREFGASFCSDGETALGT